MKCYKGLDDVLDEHLNYRKIQKGKFDTRCNMSWWTNLLTPFLLQVSRTPNLVMMFTGSFPCMLLVSEIQSRSIGIFGVCK